MHITFILYPNIECARQARKKLQLVPAPKNETELPWWDEYYSNPRKARDRELFA